MVEGRRRVWKGAARRLEVWRSTCGTSLRVVKREVMRPVR